MLGYRLFEHQENCPLRIMFIASNPLKVRRAVLNEPNPNPGLVSRLINLWSCSTRLFKNLTCRSSVVLVSCSEVLRSSTAGGYAAFLSTLITLGS
jgi:hypothetical protein